MKFLIFFALAFATASARDLYSRSIEDSVLENEGRITNGLIATSEDFKYMVGISLGVASTTIWCGGSLIAENWILSAAHCTIDALWANVFLGSTEINVPDLTYYVFKRDIYIPKYWIPSNLTNDISLIRVPTISPSSTIGFVRIPSENDNTYIGNSVVVSGWGQTRDGGKKFTDILRYAILEVSPGNICFESYGLAFQDGVHICVATPKKVSTCNGDSGGPLVLKEQNLQIGVDSFRGSRNCTTKAPLIFTRVSAHLPWIKEITGIKY